MTYDHTNLFVHFEQANLTAHNFENHQKKEIAVSHCDMKRNTKKSIRTNWYSDKWVSMIFPFEILQN